MRIINFEPGDPVRVTRTALVGTIYQTGGKYAQIMTDQGVFRFPLTRLRHTGYPLTRRIKKIVLQIKTDLRGVAGFSVPA